MNPGFTMTFLHIASLLFLVGKYCEVLGAGELEITSGESCFSEMSNAVLEVKYSGSGTPDILQWKFDKMINPLSVLNILTSICIAASGADINFPLDRMNYTCDNTNKEYTLTINNFNETSDAGIWEAAVSISGTFTNFSSFAVKKCSGGDSNGKPCGCPWWCILIICCLLYLCGIVIGIFMYCCKDEPCNKCYVGDKIPCWVWIPIIIIVGLGILTVYAICKYCGHFGCCGCCGNNNAKNESEPDPMQEKMKMAEDLASHDQDKNAL